MKIIRHGVQCNPRLCAKVIYHFYCWACGCEWENDPSEVFENYSDTARGKLGICPDCNNLSSTFTTNIEL